MTSEIISDRWYAATYRFGMNVPGPDVPVTPIPAYSSQWLNQMQLENLGTVNPTKDNLKVYPNPASSAVIIQSNDPILETKIYNTVGALIMTSKDTSINIANLPAGVYFMEVYTNNHKTIQKKNKSTYSSTHSNLNIKLRLFLIIPVTSDSLLYLELDELYSLNKINCNLQFISVFYKVNHLLF